MKKWILIFVMLPGIALAQSITPGGVGTTNADSLQGRPLPPNSSPSDNQLLKVDITPDPDTFYWANDNSAAGGDTALYLAAANGALPYVNMTGDTVWVKGTTGGVDDVHIRAGTGDLLVVWPDTIIISGDRIIDFAGTGLSVISGILITDLGTSIDYTEINATTSANWATVVSDETGTGLWTFATQPTFTTDITAPLVIGGTGTTSDLSFKTTSGAGETGADMHFLVGDNGGTEAMTILNNGDVGIGTTTPSSIIHIKANIPGTVGSHPAGQLIIQNPANSVLSNVVITAYESDAGGAPDQQLWFLGSSSSSNSNITFLNRRNSGLALGTNDLTRLTISETGNVGIGETDPDEKLHVTDNSVALKLEDDSGNWGNVSVGNSQLCLEIDPDDLVVSSDICFDIDGNEVARLHQSGDFGVGTLSPPEKISAVGNIATGDTAAGDVDVFHYFSTDGSWITEYLKWDDGLSEFQLSDDLDITGNVIVNGKTITGEKYWTFTLADPNVLYDLDTQFSIDPRTEAALTVTRIDVTLDADPTTELEYSLKFADAFIGFASATVIEDTATVAGVTTVTTITGDATVPANKAIYIQFEADPDANITQMAVKVWWDYD